MNWYSKTYHKRYHDIYEIMQLLYKLDIIDSHHMIMLDVYDIESYIYKFTSCKREKYIRKRL